MDINLELLNGLTETIANVGFPHLYCHVSLKPNGNEGGPHD